MSSKQACRRSDAPRAEERLFRLSHLYLSSTDDFPTAGLAEAFDKAGHHLRHLFFMHGFPEFHPWQAPTRGEGPSAGDIVVSACPNLTRLWIQDFFLDATALAGLHNLQKLDAIVMHPARLVKALSRAQLSSLKAINVAGAPGPPDSDDPRTETLVKSLRDLDLGKDCEVSSEFFTSMYMNGHFASGLPNYQPH